MKNNNTFNTIKKLLLLIILVVIGFGITLLVYFSYNAGFFNKSKVEEKPKETYEPKVKLWTALSMDAAIHEKNPELITYGKELVANTSKYLGPKGSVKHISNGMNCQNCHLDAGTKPWGNNYGAVLATYPKFRARSGTIEGIEKRINDCFERSLNGQALDLQSKEMQAMVAYIKFIGQFVPKDSIPAGSGIWKLKFMKRAADPEKGKLAYLEKCSSCHQKNGQGIINPEGTGYTYPPLWGNHSYNHGAGLYRISRFAGYIKANMPLGVTWDKPQLSDEESWDIAAFVNSQERPRKDLSKDWPNITKKPSDHPFGPFADNFPENQHKYGPYKPIEDFNKSNKK